MAKTIKKATPEEVRDYLDLLEFIVERFNNPDLTELHMDELPPERYEMEKKFINRLIGQSDIKLGKADRDMLRCGPFHRFNDSRLDHAAQIHVAHRLISVESDWRGYSEQKKTLCAAHQLLLRQIGDLRGRSSAFTDQQVYEDRLSELTTKLDGVTATLEHTYERLLELRERFCELLNMAYSQQYTYGHPWVKGVMAPPAPEDYSETQAYYELQANEFYAESMQVIGLAVELRPRICIYDRWPAIAPVAN